MPNQLLMAMTTIIVFGLGMLAYTSQPAEWIPGIVAMIDPPEPVLVVVVGNRVLVQSVRRAISPDRIAADGVDAFALVDRRVIAANAEAASDPINQLGWIDDPIEMVSVVTDGGRRWEENRRQNAGDRGMSEEQRQQAAQIANLMNKPSLNAAQANMVLQHMDTTGQF
ncbi:MAG: hypothetical protein ACI8W3_000915 [Myxococcota bacterium]|jgi:hypothetical protein